MTSDKWNARMVGVLYITATVAGLIGAMVSEPLQNASDLLAYVSANETQVLIGAIFSIILALAAAGIAIFMYPSLKKQNESIALGAVGFRIIENVFILVGVGNLLLLLKLSQEYVEAGDAPYFHTLGEVFLEGFYGQVQVTFAFGLGALMYYYLFYQSKLIPRWLSGWGLLAIALVLANGLFLMFGFYASFSALHILLDLPLAIQEMALAVWLIVKGFDSTALVSLNTKSDT